MLLDLDQIYHEWLLEEDRINKEKRYSDNPTALHISMGGHCYLKHWFQKHSDKYPQKESDPKSMRVMRLGTLVHKDYEAAIIFWLEKNHPKVYKHFVTMEIKVVYTENVLGHPDIYIVSVNKDKLIVIDIKTIHTYKWKMKFIQDDPNPNFFYENQLASYALAIAKKEKIKLENIEMYIYWYKKDDSITKLVPVGNYFLAEAGAYWKDIDYFVNNNDENSLAQITPKQTPHCPSYKWECGKYCGWTEHCNKITQGVS